MTMHQLVRGSSSDDREAAVFALLARPAWHSRAACRGQGPESWYPSTAAEQRQVALATCARCPVRRECREAGLREIYGVWGGLTERERQGLRRERRCG